MSTFDVTRSHWIQTLVGTLDAAFHLTEVEQYAVSCAIRALLDQLNIADRDQPSQIPAAVALEMHADFFTEGMRSAQEARQTRPVRQISEMDIPLSSSTWVNGLLGQLTAAYPELQAHERLAAAKTFHQILAAIGVPQRAAFYVPAEVLRAHSMDP